MSGTNRYIDGELSITLLSVQGGVTVEIGDLMFYDTTDNLRFDGSSTGEGYAFPFSYFRLSGASLTLNQAGVKSYFIGVAMDDKDGQSGSPDMKLSIATEGKFEFPLKPSRTVVAGSYFGASGTTGASDLYDQKIKKVSGVSFALGSFAESKNNAQSAEVFINTILGRNRLVQ